MKIVFRVDASIEIGTGHVMRCLTLADALKQKGAECYFICREHSGNLIITIKERGYEVYPLPLYEQHQNNEQDIFYSKLDHAAWLGVSQEVDADLSIPIIRLLKPDWVIVDHYAIDSHWEKKLRPYCTHIMVIDDLADRFHNCDLLLDQNYLPSYSKRYKNLIQKSTQDLLGPDYVLLRDEFVNRNPVNNLCGDSSKNKIILVNFGGVGNYELLEKVVKATVDNPHYDYLIITGQLSFEELKKLNTINNGSAQIIEKASNMANIMQKSHFAIGACGSTVWERFSIGLNSALVEMAINQKPLLDYLDENNLIDNLGHYKNLTTQFFIGYIRNLNLDDKKYVLRKARIMDLIDGKGAERVSNIILQGVRRC